MLRCMIRTCVEALGMRGRASNQPAPPLVPNNLDASVLQVVLTCEERDADRSFLDVGFLCYVATATNPHSMPCAGAQWSFAATTCRRAGETDKQLAVSACQGDNRCSRYEKAGAGESGSAEVCRLTGVTQTGLGGQAPPRRNHGPPIPGVLYAGPLFESTWGAEEGILSSHGGFLLEKVLEARELDSSLLLPRFVLGGGARCSTAALDGSNSPLGEQLGPVGSIVPTWTEQGVSATARGSDNTLSVRLARL